MVSGCKICTLVSIVCFSHVQCALSSSAVVRVIVLSTLLIVTTLWGIHTDAVNHLHWTPLPYSWQDSKNIYRPCVPVTPSGRIKHRITSCAQTLLS